MSWVHVLNRHLFQLLIINNNLRVPSFFVTNNIGAPQGDKIGLTYPLSGISLSYNFNFTNSGVFILKDAFDDGVAPGTNSIEKSTSL